MPTNPQLTPPATSAELAAREQAVNEKQQKLEAMRKEVALLEAEAHPPEEPAEPETVADVIADVLALLAIYRGDDVAIFRSRLARAKGTYPAAPATKKARLAEPIPPNETPADARAREARDRKMNEEAR